MAFSQQMSKVMIIKSIADWLKVHKQISTSRDIGFIPTMGNLHLGHQSLCERSKKENDITVLSIFINPTQFDCTKDFCAYPKTISEDIKLAEKTGVDFVFMPNYADLYPDNYTYKIIENDLSNQMEGMHRHGHFDGVLTIVMKLFMIIQPTKAYFGEKDWQQLQLVKGMVKALHSNIEIVSCPTIRDINGLALSSRNNLLNKQQYQIAINFPKLLMSDKSLTEVKTLLEKLGIKVDYIEEHYGRRFAAVRLGNVRLIDNVEIK
jgi:pantoate--beta-alanine ligase